MDWLHGIRTWYWTFRRWTYFVQFPGGFQFRINGYGLAVNTEALAARFLPVSWMVAQEWPAVVRLLRPAEWER
jgi:hypothetical protein